jgi:hypothetical protein
MYELWRWFLFGCGRKQLHSMRRRMAPRRGRDDLVRCVRCGVVFGIGVGRMLLVPSGRLPRERRGVKLHELCGELVLDDSGSHDIDDLRGVHWGHELTGGFCRMFELPRGAIHEQQLRELPSRIVLTGRSGRLCQLRGWDICVELSLDGLYPLRHGPLFRGHGSIVLGRLRPMLGWVVLGCRVGYMLHVHCRVLLEYFRWIKLLHMRGGYVCGSIRSSHMLSLRCRKLPEHHRGCGLFELPSGVIFSCDWRRFVDELRRVRVGLLSVDLGGGELHELQRRHVRDHERHDNLGRLPKMCCRRLPGVGRIYSMC